MLPKWFREELDNPDKDNVKEKANKQEKDFAKKTRKLGGKRQPASGALWSAKGDVSLGKYALGDNKYTKYKSFKIDRGMWRKIKHEALEQSKEIPFLQIEMNEVEPLVVLSENDFLMLLENYIRGRVE